MSSNVIAFLSGLGTGIIQGQDKKDKDKRDEEDRALRNKASQLQINAAEKQVSDQAALATAGQPIAMTQGAGGMLKPATMDNRDVGLPENASLPNQGLNEGGFNVAGKQFTDPAAAQAAVAAQNTPEATQKRVLAAQMGIDPSKGIAMQRDIAQATVADVQAADAVFRNKLGVAMAFGHDGLAKLITEAQSDGLADHQLKAVVSPDGKTVTYNKVDKDGKLTPTPLTFPNSEEGVISAAYRLDKAITPAMRADFALKMKKEGREDKETDSKVKLQGAQTNYYNAAADLKDNTDPNAKGKVAAVDRMSEIDKSTLGTINKTRETINTAITKAQAEGSWDENSPGAKKLQTRLATLAMQESKLQSKYAGEAGGGLPDPAGLRGSGGKTPAATQAARDTDAFAIKQDELVKAEGRLATAKTQEERVRAQGDIDALNKELGRAGKKAPAAAPAPIAATQGTGMKPPVAAPAPAPVAAPAAPKNAIAAALGAASGNKAVDQVVGAKVPQLEAAATAIKTAQASLAAATKSGDPKSLSLYATQMTQAKAKFDALIADMNPQQAEAVRQAAGYYL